MPGIVVSETLTRQQPNQYRYPRVDCPQHKIQTAKFHRYPVRPRRVRYIELEDPGLQLLSTPLQKYPRFLWVSESPGMSFIAPPECRKSSVLKLFVPTVPLSHVVTPDATQFTCMRQSTLQSGETPQCPRQAARNPDRSLSDETKRTYIYSDSKHLCGVNRRSCSLPESI